MIVEDWHEFGHHLQIEKLEVPRQVGSGIRYYRLWDNGSPATGGQYHYTVEGAKRRAEYLIQSSYIRRIQWLEQEVARLTRIEFRADLDFDQACGD